MLHGFHFVRRKETTSKKTFKHIITKTRLVHAWIGVHCLVSFVTWFSGRDPRNPAALLAKVVM